VRSSLSAMDVQSRLPSVVAGSQPTKLEKETSRRIRLSAPIRSTAFAPFDRQTLILPPLRSNAVASIASRQQRRWILPRMTSVELPSCWTSCRAVAHADPETAPVWVTVPRTELRSCPTKTLTNPHGRHRVAQAVLSPRGSSEKRCVSTDCRSCIPLNAELVTYRLPRKETPWCPDLRCGLSKLSGLPAQDDAADQDSRGSRCARGLKCKGRPNRSREFPSAFRTIASCLESLRLR
jgi:hypothetical protein